MSHSRRDRLVEVDSADDDVLYADMIRVAGPGSVGAVMRRIDYYTSCGYLRTRKQHPGQGRRRRWLAGEDRVLEMIVRLTAAGMLPEKAAPIARQLISHGCVHLGGGTYLIQLARGDS